MPAAFGTVKCAKKPATETTKRFELFFVFNEKKKEKNVSSLCTYKKILKS